ncbi:hypothetical protein [Bradyrhizobium sp. JYMT SZCCT0428]|uniref:hypothetical protein n=1 Tax=Bradyrhizobium sp. JYMT SZCCT0428 TaxID=2807673 RepID=UPI001BA6CE11|nr:hypothetical protein [Bradyrhizobium sp. JYMT SZCCT0428]MBR1150103.1 hypothetical protein [Bradyrhizobium sp. JYMT SZCCT0428]
MSQVVSKAAFARLKNVSAARVSQWISGGKINGAALVGEGRNAQIDVTIADQQLRERLDIGQRVGNGLATRLGDTPEASPEMPLAVAPPAAPAAAAPATDKFEEAFKRERLEALQRENRKRAEEEAARAGRYVDAQAASAQMAKIAGKTMTMIDGSLPEIASALAAKFSLPQRDVLHALRAEFRGLRQQAADSLRTEAAGLPAIVETELASDTDELVLA